MLTANSIPQDDTNGSQPNQEKPDTQPAPSSPVSKYSKKRSFGRLVYILLLGPSGAGKTSLSNAVCDEQAPVAAPGSGLCTTGFRYRAFTLAEHEVRLIDTPGFTTSSSHNRDVLYRLVRYLMKIYDDRGHEITGVVYLHPEGSNIDCNHLKQNMSALRDLIGDRYLSHLKIAVVPNNSGTNVNADSTHALQNHTSPFHEVLSKGAQLVDLSLDSGSIQGFLLGYTTLHFRLLRVQWRMKTGEIRHLGSYIGGILGLVSTEARSPHSHRSADRASSRSLGNDLTEATERCRHLELALAESEVETKLLRDQLEQTRSEYASLRSELQLSDNMEQSKIVQSLKNLNRGIENLGRSIAEHIVDNHVSPYTNDETTLKASNLPQIKVQFYHQEGSPSLVESSSGAGMPTEDFFDLGVRSILCRRLHENIFLPFHPTLAGDPRNEFMDHQSIASKWRANSFLALSNNDDPEIRAKHVHGCVEKIMTRDLNVLFANFFGERTSASLAELHKIELEKLVSLAWEWNHILKGSVIVLGDFQPTVYESGVPFDPSRMVDFEPDRKSKKVPSTALCTIGFGLMVSRSKDKGNVLDDVDVCKASVVTEHVYE
ncbi:hypothetical protein FRC06_010032 [Ceratobasidium sp. 370]|nr:hypothetical protein FRC06_010032 [Ceratobasidium sp. 370]